MSNPIMSNKMWVSQNFAQLASIKGFRFRQVQKVSIWRKVQALGMADLYKNDVATRNFIHKVGTLPFVPARFIRIAEVTIEQLSGDRRVRAKKRKVVKHEETIEKLMADYTGGVRKLKSFFIKLLALNSL